MKVKHTLIISSLILVLVLAVTIVSVSAAWFGDTLSVTREINIQTELPEGQIVIDTASAINNERDVLVPTIMNEGWMLESTTNISQSLNVLDSSLVGTGKPFKSLATTKKIYFPIGGIGELDTYGKFPVMVEITGAYIPLDSATGVDEDTSVNYIGDFIVSMCVVKDAVEDEETYETTCTYITSTEYGSGLASEEAVYWKYNSSAYKLGMLINPNDTYYIELSITFGKVDEELPPELLDTLIKININVPATAEESDVLAL